ncbi:MAG: nucleotidyltransferase family protein [Solirubrobacteraceae bacterium]
MLLSAGTTARRDATRGLIDELVALADWSLVIDLLRARGLLPLLGPRLADLAGERAGDEFAVVVTQAIDAGRRQGAFLQLISARVMSALGDAGITSTALKGPRLSEALYGDAGRRLSSDIDLLVAPEQLIEAVAIVRGLGYMAPTDHIEEGGLPLLHFALLHERGELPPVELHWRVHWYEQSFARERLLAPSGAPGDDWHPAPIDELAALLLFYARDGFINLRLAADIGAWWDAFGADLPSGALDDLLHAYPAFQRVLPVAVRVAERVVGLPCGQLTQRRLRLSSRGRIALRLANPRPRPSEAQLYADIGLIDGLLAPPGTFRAFVKRQVIVPQEVIRQHAVNAQEQRVSSTLGYSLRVLGRYGLAMIRLLCTS